MKNRKILFACVPGDGHFNPLTGLANHLIECGYDVAWYSASYYKPRLEKLGIPFFKFTKAMDITSNDLETPFPERSKIESQPGKLMFDMEHFFIRRGPEYYEDMKEIHKTFPFELLVADALFTGGLYVKELMNIPVISVGVIPLASTSKDLPPSGIGMTPSYSFAGKIKQSLLLAFVMNILFRKPNKLQHSMMDRYGIKHNKEFLFDLIYSRPDLVLQIGTPGFEYKRSDLGSNIRYIGALLPYYNKEKKQAWFDERINRYDRVVLLTQGTVEKDVNKLLIPTLEAFKDSNILVVCTTGGSNTAELKAKYPNDNFIIEDFISFNDVMPLVDVYITNGGYGGVLLGIQNKLPMVVAGVHEGKNEICARIGYLKYGIDLKTETPKPEQIRDAVNEIFNNKEYAQNIDKLSKEFAQYNPNKLMEKYVAELIS
jgi:UDP:flavonoid glycosyltransferase YjiC (YdhE family)